MKTMLKTVAMFGLMLALTSVARAGTPQEQFFPNQFPLSNASIVGSTATLLGTANLTVALPPGTVNGVVCRNCFTKFFVQIPTTTIISVLDGATTAQTIDGSGLGTTGTNSLSLPEDHLGPLCLTAGNTTTINAVTTAGLAANHQVINYEGYTACGGSNNSGR